MTTKNKTYADVISLSTFHIPQDSIEGRYDSVTGERIVRKYKGDVTTVLNHLVMVVDDKDHPFEGFDLQFIKAIIKGVRSHVKVLAYKTQDDDETLRHKAEKGLNEVVSMVRNLADTI